MINDAHHNIIWHNFDSKSKRLWRRLRFDKPSDRICTLHLGRTVVRSTGNFQIVLFQKKY